MYKALDKDGNVIAAAFSLSLLLKMMEGRDYILVPPTPTT